jgi:hypothetical protein
VGSVRQKAPAGGASAPVDRVRTAVGQLAGGARRLLAERPGARVRRVRRMGQQPLANLWEIHPDARRATLREIAPRPIPVELVAGTAVEGPVQRGGDFLPVRDRRGDDWRARWQRIRDAVDQLTLLPPIDVIKYGEGYWVLDGHNRVAAALYAGQVDIDANVVEARLPGLPADPLPGSIAPYLSGSLEVRAAGLGQRPRQAHQHERVRPPGTRPEPQAD